MPHGAAFHLGLHCLPKYRLRVLKRVFVVYLYEVADVFHVFFSIFSHVSVLYGGNEIFDYEIETTFWNDIKLAGFALGAIFLLMLILTSGSLWLTVMGLFSILLSAPLAIFFYRVAFKIIGLGILNGASAFVIIGIGMCQLNLKAPSIICSRRQFKILLLFQK